jgi:hypothetical protein
VNDSKKKKLLGTPAIPTTSYSTRSMTFISLTGLSKFPMKKSIVGLLEFHPYELGRIMFW